MNDMIYGISFDKINVTNKEHAQKFIRTLFLYPHIDCSRAILFLDKISDENVDEFLSDFETKLSEYTDSLNIRDNDNGNLQALLKKLSDWQNYFTNLTESEMTEFLNIHKISYLIFEEFESKKEACKALNPIAIKWILDKYIIGQENAKQAISFAFYLHMLRNAIIIPPIIVGTPMQSSLMNYKLPKPSVLLVGQTGTGKTYIVKTLCKLFDIPFVKIDCASLTSSGYTGKGVNDYIFDLYKKLEKDVSKLEKAIIYFDEIDKLSEFHTGNRGSVGGVELQQEFLTMLEDEEIMIEAPKNSGEENLKLKAGNLMFVFSGSFAGIEEIITNRLKGNKKIGFSSESKIDEKQLNLLEMIKPKDIIDFGIIPELVGRISFVESLNPLSVEDLKRIMTETKDSPLEQYMNFFRVHLDELIIEDKVYDLIASKAIEMGGGGRSLMAVLQELLKDFLFKAPNMYKEKFIIDKTYFESVFV